MLSSINSRLPGEMIDRVIDHLHDDKRSLSACSLVCTLWQPASRFHLFRHVKLSDAFSETSESLFGLVSRFLTDVKHLCFNVEHLHISYEHETLTYPLLDNILRHMPRVHSLAFTGILWRVKHSSLNPLASYPLIKSLTFETVHFTSSGDIGTSIECFPLLSLFPHARELRLLNIEDPFDYPSDFFPNHLALRSFKADHSCEGTPALLAALSITSTVDSLTHLDVGWIVNPGLFQALRELDVRIKKHLVFLRVGLDDISDLIERDETGESLYQP